MYRYDTETVGFCGPIVLIQYHQAPDEPITLHHVWYEPVRDTLNLIERMMEAGTMGFNLAFDHFHLCQFYTVARLLKDLDSPPNHLEYWDKEPDGRDGPCLRPAHALDLMLVARKGPYQSTMDRKPIRIKRVPTKLVQPLINHLLTCVPLKSLYFANKSNPNQRWQILDCFDAKTGLYDENFKDLKLEFAPSAKLKVLIADILGNEVGDNVEDTGLGPSMMPDELGYAPWGKAVELPNKDAGYNEPKAKSWKWYLRQHMEHWRYTDRAIEYATNDVRYLDILYDHFGKPEPDDDDSVLACAVGAARWRGFAIDVNRLRLLKKYKKKQLLRMPVNPRSPTQVKDWLHQCLSPIERPLLTSTGKKQLEALSKRYKTEICSVCQGMVECKVCKGGLIETDELEEVAKRARDILSYRRRAKEVELCDKLLHAGRMHASFKVIGALSGRMSGSDKMNAQAINRSKRMRRCFPLSDHVNDELAGGDYDAFEISIMDAVYADPVLHADLSSGTCVHTMFGSMLYGKTYDEIKATAKLPSERNLRGRAKNCLFGIIYGAQESKTAETAGISVEEARVGYNKLTARYKKLGAERERYAMMFCSMRQPGGIGTKVEWHEPADYIESIFGFRRYFTLENRICKAIFDLATNLPDELSKITLKVTRRDRVQTMGGAVRSALYAAAFNIQAQNTRASGNHVIQSSGASVTKKLQCAIWQLQPSGVHSWQVMPLNVHDEIQCVHHKSMRQIVKQTVDAFNQSQRQFVPLLKMTWTTGMNTWADK